MTYVFQLLIILLFSLIGEILSVVIPLPVPGSIWGLVLLFTALMTGIVRLKQVKETGHYLIEIMALTFIAPAVGLLKSWEVLLPVLVPVVIIVTVSLVAVMAVSGRVTQAINRKPAEKGADRANA